MRVTIGLLEGWGMVTSILLGGVHVNATSQI